MSLVNFSSAMQYLSWIIALLEMIFGLYALVLNYRNTANRYLSAYLLLLALNTYAIGAMVAAQTAVQAQQPAMLLALTAPAIQPGLLVVAIILLKPNWQRSRMRWLVRLGYVLVLLPAALLFVDAVTGSHLWYTGISAVTYSGGYVPLLDYTQGLMGYPIWVVNFILSGLLVIFSLLYLAIFDKQVFPKSRPLAWLLLSAQILVSLLLVFGSQFADPAITALFASTLFAATYGYASFQQMVSERRMQQGRLQVRLTALVLVVTIPVVLSLVLFLTNQAEAQMRQVATDRLNIVNDHLSDTTRLWIDTQTRALDGLVRMPDITSMDPKQQLPALQAMTISHPWMSLVTTVDLQGTTIARSDNAPGMSYRNEQWFKDIRNGGSVSNQVMAGTNGKGPSLVMAVPIHDSNGNLIGAGMFSSLLSSMTGEMRTVYAGTRGQSYLIDRDNLVLVHPEVKNVMSLTDFSSQPPVVQLREGKRGEIQFKDHNGEAWYAYVSELPSGWGVIVQQPESELFASLRFLRNITLIILVSAGAMLSALVWLTIRQSIQPINTLTRTATSIAAGDLTRMAPVESEDELGVLARAFNTMTSQLRSLISGLEVRVAERTQALQKRAVHLEVTAQVARESAGIYELQKMLDQTARLVSERFDFYHCGIFLLDDPGEYAILRAASSEGGSRMLARGHRLAVGQTGIVGYVAAHGEARVALDVGADAVFFNNPDLPQTRSEAALPLTVRERVIGVLDVQSTQPAAFEQEDVEVLQVLADQVALAIENARLIEESQLAFAELQTLYGKQVQQIWQRRLERQPITYTYDRLGVQRLQGSPPADTWGDDPDGCVLNVPIELRGLRLGVLAFRRDPLKGPWSPEEVELTQDAAKQIALALDNARLVETVQRNAYQEQLVGEIAAKTQSSLALESVMKIAVQELGHAIGASRVQIRLGNGTGNGSSSASQSEAESSSRRQER